MPKYPPYPESDPYAYHLGNLTPSERRKLVPAPGYTLIDTPAGPRATGFQRIPDSRDLNYSPETLRVALEQQIIPNAGVEERRAALAPRTTPYRLGPVLDQGNRPTCVTNTMLGWLMSAPIMTVPPAAPQRWAELAYTWSQQNDEWDGEYYDGTSVRAGLQYLRKQTGHAASFARLLSVDEGINWLKSPVGSPIPIGVDLFQNMAQPDSKNLGAASGRWLGGHAMLWYWYSERTGLCFIRNSWGEDWANRGNFALPVADLRYLIETLGGDAYAATQVRLPGERLQSPIRR